MAENLITGVSMGNRNPLKIFTGNAHPALAKEICEHLQLQLGDAQVGRFPDGEVEVQIGENVRGADVFVVQPPSPPVNDHVMELLFMLDAFRRASAYRITAVMPYYGYARQDRKARPSVPISGTLVRAAETLREKGAEKVFACCVHGVFARDAVSRICNSELELVIATNSIPLSEAGQNCARIKILSVAKLFAEAIRSIHDETSV